VKRQRSKSHCTIYPTPCGHDRETTTKAWQELGKAQAFIWWLKNKTGVHQENTS
jgi:hypothetical protein